jgi:putative membrane protein
MIEHYSDHAANERTFLAWARTAIAVMAFGLVIEKFNLFLSTIASSGLAQQADRSELQRLSGSFGRNEGLALILAGAVLLVVSTARFVRTTRLLDDPAMYSAKNVRAELVFSGLLVLMVASYGIYLALR